MDLLEAEGRMLRTTVMRTGGGLALLVAAGLLLFAGVALCLWALYLVVAAHLGASGAAVLIGALALILAGLLAWIATTIAR
jgi:hypothetical protein